MLSMHCKGRDADAAAVQAVDKSVCVTSEQTDLELLKFSNEATSLTDPPTSEGCDQAA